MVGAEGRAVGGGEACGLSMTSNKRRDAVVDTFMQRYTNNVIGNPTMHVTVIVNSKNAFEFVEASFLELSYIWLRKRLS